MTSSCITKRNDLLSLPLWTIISLENNSAFRELTADERTLFFTRLTRLFHQEGPTGKMVYRGTNLELLSEILCSSEQKNNIPHLYSNLFYFGEKAAYYINENKKVALSSSLETLFFALSKQLSVARQQNRPEVLEFCSQEQELKIFFSNIDNKRLFLEKVEKNEALYKFSFNLKEL